MRTRRPRDPIYALPLALLAAVTTLVLIAAGGRGAEQPLRLGGETWKGLAGEQRPRIAVGQRMIVVLKAPSLSDRVGEVGGLVTSEQERGWNSSALAAQKLLISRLGVQGVVVQPEYSYTRVVNGFSAAFDANGLAVLERAPEVAGVFPVRAAYPASRSATLVPSVAYRPLMGLSDRDGRGIRIALLDTGVDRAQPFLRGRVAGGVDVVGGDADVSAAPTGRRWQASLSARAARVRSRASPRAPPSCRSASQAGSGTHRRSGRSTGAPTRSSPASSARSIRTATGTRTTRPASRSSA
jgi:subtilisin family serine protease